jgi:hypothetical protein
MRFFDCFHGTFDNPTEGLQKLHSFLLRDLMEAEELLLFLKSRIALEEYYSSRLLDLKTKELSGNGFKKDESRMSSVVFLKYKTV